MIVKKVTQVGNPIIRARAKRVVDLKSREVKKVIANLVDSMRYHDLVGMAAPQINKGLRIFVSEIRPTKTRKNRGPKDLDPLRVYINPKIIWFSKNRVSGHEGCGSVASTGLFAKVTRPKNVIVVAWNESGERFELKAGNLLARVIQHEYDHINGVIFTDKADPKTYISRNEFLAQSKKKK